MSLALEDGALRDEAVDLLRALLRIDTSNPPGHETPAALLLKEYLERAGVECELVARRPDRANLIARIRGSGDGPSLALLGHTDVVPAEARDWTHPPFSGHLDAGGFVWGRGAVDMKNETATRAVTMAVLARSGFAPRGDLLFIAQADEEDGTEEVGLTWLRHERPDLRCDYILDEGGGARRVLRDGRVVVPITVGEKATLPVTVTALGEAGHASQPASGANAVVLLAELIARLARHRTTCHLLPQTTRLLEQLGGPPGDDVDAALDRAIALHPAWRTELPPLFGATIAPTRLHGSRALNVMPGRASVECDCRLLPGMTRADLEREVRAALGTDLAYELDFPAPRIGGTASPLDTPLYAACQQFLDQHDPGAMLLPTLSTGFTDSHFMRDTFGAVAYGFWPCKHTPLDVYHAGIHNKDERIHVDDLLYATRFHLHAARAIGAMRR